MGQDAWRLRELRSFQLKFSVSTCPAIPGPCEEELKFTLLQLQEKNKSLQLNVLESPTTESKLSPRQGLEVPIRMRAELNALESPISECKQNLRNSSTPSENPLDQPIKNPAVT